MAQRERLPDGRRKPKARPRLLRGCEHRTVHGLEGFCEACIARLETKLVQLELRSAKRTWAQQDRAAELAMRFGPPKARKPMSEATFVRKVREAGPRL